MNFIIGLFLAPYTIWIAHKNGAVCTRCLLLRHSPNICAMVVMVLFFSSSSLFQLFILSLLHFIDTNCSQGIDGLWRCCCCCSVGSCYCRFCLSTNNDFSPIIPFTKLHILKWLWVCVCVLMRSCARAHINVFNKPNYKIIANFSITYTDREQTMCFVYC